ncbi:MAG: hypothetical protein WKF78_07385 [Candidatus Limnocylindrales bacterium]
MSRLPAVGLVTLALISVAFAAPAAAISRPDPAGRYLVVLRGDADVDAVEQRARTRLEVAPTHTYRNAIKGFSASTDTDVSSWPFARIPPSPSSRPTASSSWRARCYPPAVNRVDADLSPTAAINGTDTPG